LIEINTNFWPLQKASSRPMIPEHLQADWGRIRLPKLQRDASNSADDMPVELFAVLHQQRFSA
jgi:hypothetical protein